MNVQATKVENGWKILVNAQPAVSSRELVATSDADCKKQLHDAVDSLFSTKPEKK